MEMRVTGPRTAQADIPARKDASVGTQDSASGHSGKARCECRDPGQRKRPHPSSTQPLSLRDDDASPWFMMRLWRMILVVEPILLHFLRTLSISDTIVMRKAMRQFVGLIPAKFPDIPRSTFLLN